MPVVPEQLPPGSQNDPGDHERIDKSPAAPTGQSDRWVPNYFGGTEVGIVVFLAKGSNPSAILQSFFMALPRLTS